MRERGKQRRARSRVPCHVPSFCDNCRRDAAISVPSACRCWRCRRPAEAHGVPGDGREVLGVQGDRVSWTARCALRSRRRRSGSGRCSTSEGTSAGRRSTTKSELRAITIIDGLCPTMQHYGKIRTESRAGCGSIMRRGTWSRRHHDPGRAEEHDRRQGPQALS